MALAIGQENGDCRLSGSNGAKKYANASSLLDTWAVTHYALPMRPTREELHQLVQRERKLKNRLRLATTRLEEAERERIWAIVAAHHAGLSIRKIAATTGLSRSRIHQLLQEHEAQEIPEWLTHLRERECTPGIPADTDQHAPDAS